MNGYNCQIFAYIFRAGAAVLLDNIVYFYLHIECTTNQLHEQIDLIIKGSVSISASNSIACRNIESAGKQREQVSASDALHYIYFS